MSEIALVYTTAPDGETARSLARAVVEERLAACANILGAIASVYWWDGRVNEDDEVAMILKTTTGRVEALVGRLRQLHPYQCPCIVMLPVSGGNPDFLAWVAAETACRV